MDLDPLSLHGSDHPGMVYRGGVHVYKSSKQLWDELAERYGESNGPLRYQLQKEKANFSQGTSTVTVYFTKLKCLWDEYACIVQIPECVCGAGRVICANDMDIKLLQFLMGLIESFEPVKNQILLMDLLPTVNKVYSMILKVEKQKVIHNKLLDPLDIVGMMARESVNRGITGQGGSSHGRGLNKSGGNLTCMAEAEVSREKVRRKKQSCNVITVILMVMR
ncbi:hypothetical protein DH2020_040496 [Rehmannia glutinosa]|uniref:Retrotransposon gag domain-containing protein n=1 Tax=Rehmannia glutinosa TaxID=99300 RepID=A0ABR0UUT8_REHGL